jgi:dihydroxyacetone kinase-like protein
MDKSLASTEFVVRAIAEECVANERYFGDLDSVVGDGDFGYSLARGFEIVLEDWEDTDRADSGSFLNKIAMKITNRIGGTSGPIWGTAFLRVGSQLKGKSPVTPEDVITGLREAVAGIKKRGGAELGDKTLLDSLVPAIDALEASLAAGESTKAALGASAIAARTAAEATSTMIARRGRASYSGERSVGSVDAGAIAVAVLAERISRTWPDD